MKKIKTITISIAVLLMVSILSFTTLAAPTYNSPAEAVAGLSGKSQEEVLNERNAGKTYGNMAKDAGKLEEFKKEMMETKRARLEESVTNGKMTREQADAILERLRLRLENCDGTGTGNKTQGIGGFGNKNQDGSCDGVNCENGGLGLSGFGNGTRAQDGTGSGNSGQRGSKGSGGYDGACPNN
ncbi:MAG: hypothetical protein GX222_02030 [Ruminococcaceae bacterium]|nr:hypothetical protein [Oscillospiraceae bacterium]